MSMVALGVTFGRRDAAQTPLVNVKNLVLEPNLTNQVDGKSWISRPGMVDYPSPPDGLFRGAFQRPGTFNGDVFIVSGTAIYRQAITGDGQVSIGNVIGADIANFASTTTRLLVCAAGRAYSYNGTAFAQITMPGGEVVSWVTYLAGYFLFGVANSQHIFFMLDNVAAPDALDFFSAQAKPDNLVMGATLGDQLVLFCQRNVEFWQPSGDINAPFTRIVGQLYQHGLANKSCVCEADNTLFFIGDDRIVYRAEAQPVIVSDNTIGERLRKSDVNALILWSFELDGHTYVVASCDSGTFVFDAQTKSWPQWASGNSDIWLGQLGIQIDGSLVIAGSLSGRQIYQVTQDATSDSGQPIVRELTGGYPVVGPPVRCDNFQVIVDSGAAPSLTEPMTIDLRFSDDQGRTFDEWLTESAGVSGDYQAIPIWNQLGTMYAPGRVFHLRNSNDSPFRISYARINEAFA